VVQALNIPLGLLRGKVEELPRDFEILVCDDFPCRSSAAASFLRSRGFAAVSEIGGGLALWGAPPRD
jgi:rhodanese-related sulfurtransferase